VTKLPSLKIAKRVSTSRFVLLLSVITLTACAAGAPQPRPEDFPLHARDQIFVLDYRIDRKPDRVEAVDPITARTMSVFRFAVVNLFGVAANGQVVSRDTYTVNGTFGGPQSFSLAIKPTGAEVRYLVQVGHYSLGRDL
jgi:hypothetical protein